MENAMERTFTALKPDAVKRGLMGKIIERFEQKGYKIVAMKMMNVSKELAAKHYEEHLGKPFYNDLINYITSGPVVAMVVEGENVGIFYGFVCYAQIFEFIVCRKVP